MTLHYIILHINLSYPYFEVIVIVNKYSIPLNADFSMCIPSIHQTKKRKSMRNDSSRETKAIFVFEV